ncbi:hypothetical protein LGM71_29325 [Burkholderia sp. AU33545]|uniref:hypothetical protein n=1 Tax=Burkholderia sp. AU33545 TaxID=2879631 RepID=UPI001CF336B7|nr:hypothetical protein [Burkholderia sp. AU33545]MCA8205144.1 hypothetical protein [Burkholderia sp. AU33545]
MRLALSVMAFSVLLTVLAIRILHLTALHCCGGRAHDIGEFLRANLPAALHERPTSKLGLLHIELSDAIGVLGGSSGESVVIASLLQRIEVLLCAGRHHERPESDEDSPCGNSIDEVHRVFRSQQTA